MTELEYGREIWWRKDLAGTRVWFGRAAFGCNAGQEASVAASLDGAAFPGASGLGELTPVCVGARGVPHPQHIPGLAAVMAEYESPRKVGKATLWSRSSGTMRRVTHDPETGLPIEGPDEFGNQWFCPSGVNQVPMGDEVLTLSTAYYKAGYNSSAINAIEGTCNAMGIILLGFKQCAAESLMCEAVSEKGVYGDTLIYVDFVLHRLCGMTWGSVPCVPGVWLPTEKSVYGGSGTATMREYYPNRISYGAGGSVPATPVNRRVVLRSDGWGVLSGLGTW